MEELNLKTYKNKATQAYLYWKRLDEAQSIRGQLTILIKNEDDIYFTFYDNGDISLGRGEQELFYTIDKYKNSSNIDTKFRIDCQGYTIQEQEGKEVKIPTTIFDKEDSIFILDFFKIYKNNLKTKKTLAVFDDCVLYEGKLISFDEIIENFEKLK